MNLKEEGETANTSTINRVKNYCKNRFWEIGLVALWFSAITTFVVWTSFDGDDRDKIIMNTGVWLPMVLGYVGAHLIKSFWDPIRTSSFRDQLKSWIRQLWEGFKNTVYYYTMENQVYLVSLFYLVVSLQEGLDDKDLETSTTPGFLHKLQPTLHYH